MRANDMEGKMKVFTNLAGLLLFLAVFTAVQARAAVTTNVLTLGGSPYTENFDSMGTGSTQAPLGWNAGTLTGASTTNGAISNPSSLSASTGSSTTGGNFNYGSSVGSDRAIGALSSSSITRATEVRFLNNTGLTINNLIISYDGEQWRDGGGTLTTDQIALTFSQTSMGGLTNFIAMGAAFDFTALKNGSSATALDGNAAANRTAGIGGNFSVNIAPGEVFVLRWIDPDITGNDDAMAIDNFSLGYEVIPEPSTIALVGLGLLGALLIRRRR
jgi:hypothetical protein